LAAVAIGDLRPRIPDRADARPLVEVLAGAEDGRERERADDLGRADGLVFDGQCRKWTRGSS
jgi:hypothetical protein